MLTPESLLPNTDKKLVGSMMIFEAETIEEVKKIIKDDIYYTSDVVSFTLHYFIYMHRIDNSSQVGPGANCRTAVCCGTDVKSWNDEGKTALCSNYIFIIIYVTRMKRGIKQTTCYQLPYRT